MKENRAATEQQKPKRGGRSITILVVEDLIDDLDTSTDVDRVEATHSVIKDLIDRDRMGFDKYGQNLETYDGRVTLLDAYQEILDALQYLRKAIEEMPRKRLRMMYNEILGHALILSQMLKDGEI